MIYCSNLLIDFSWYGSIWRRIFGFVYSFKWRHWMELCFEVRWNELQRLRQSLQPYNGDSTLDSTPWRGTLRVNEQVYLLFNFLQHLVWYERWLLRHWICEEPDTANCVYMSFVLLALPWVIPIKSRLCCRFVRIIQEFYTCLYSDLKDKCNATASAIYTKYNLIAEWRFFPECDVSEYTNSAFICGAKIVCVSYDRNNGWYSCS